MVKLFDDPNGTFGVLVNEDGQYAVWPQPLEVPPEWRPVGPTGTKAACVEWIDETWTDMRPQSVIDSLTPANRPSVPTARTLDGVCGGRANVAPAVSAKAASNGSPASSYPHDTPLRETNRRQARLEYAEGRAVVQSRPRALFVELTRHCNLACAMCRFPGEVPPGQRMSDELFTRIEAELFPTADLIDLRGWGESLILPEFPDRAGRAARHGAALRIVTNLSFRRDSVIDLIAELGFHVGVSIDSADADILALLRGGAKLALIEANLKRLSERYRSQGLTSRLNLYVTCQRPALPSLERIVDFASRNGIEDVRLAPVGTKLPFLALTDVRRELEDALERVREAAARTNVRVSFTASPLEGMLPNEDTRACVHPWTWCYITYEGRLGFCDHLIAADQYTLGSMKTQSFEEIWNGPAWVALRQEHTGDRRATAPNFHECAWCYRNRHVDCEDVVEPGYAAHRLVFHRRLRTANPQAIAEPRAAAALVQVP